jgi:hypothetical protein
MPRIAAGLFFVYQIFIDSTDDDSDSSNDDGSDADSSDARGQPSLQLALLPESVQQLTQN